MYIYVSLTHLPPEKKPQICHPATVCDFLILRSTRAQSCTVHVIFFISPLTAFRQKKKQAKRSSRSKVSFLWESMGEILTCHDRARSRARARPCTLLTMCLISSFQAF